MEFCPKCGAILIMRKSRVGCPKCNYIAKGNVNMEIKEEVNEKVEVAVVDEKKSNIKTITDWNCNKCNSKKAYFWIRQMRSGDEPESKFYECVKCGKTTRVDN